MFIVFQFDHSTWHASQRFLFWSDFGYLPTTQDRMDANTVRARSGPVTHYYETLKIQSSSGLCFRLFILNLFSGFYLTEDRLPYDFIVLFCVILRDNVSWRFCHSSQTILEQAYGHLEEAAPTRITRALSLMPIGLLMHAIAASDSSPHSCSRGPVSMLRVGVRRGKKRNPRTTDQRLYVVQINIVPINTPRAWAPFGVRTSCVTDVFPRHGSMQSMRSHELIPCCSRSL